MAALGNFVGLVLALQCHHPWQALFCGVGALGSVLAATADL